jgi:peptidoglycan LD-endopeptidase LytH
MIIRGIDAHGSGAYLASRGLRVHNGVDIVTEIGEEIKSQCRGVVSKIGLPYDPQNSLKAHFRYVQVTDENGLFVRHFYCDPIVEITDIIEKGQVLGVSQDLTKVYPGITQHLHFEVKRGQAYLNPLEYLDIDE